METIVVSVREGLALYETGSRGVSDTLGAKIEERRKVNHGDAAINEWTPVSSVIIKIANFLRGPPDDWLFLRGPPRDQKREGAYENRLGSRTTDGGIRSRVTE